jgi:hypothetical protein
VSGFLTFLDSSLRWNDKNGMIQMFLKVALQTRKTKRPRKSILPGAFA